MREQATLRVCCELVKLANDGVELQQHGSETLVKHPSMVWGVLRCEGCVVTHGRYEQETDAAEPVINVFSEQGGVVEWAQNRPHVFEYWLISIGVENPRVYVEWRL